MPKYKRVKKLDRTGRIHTEKSPRFEVLRRVREVEKMIAAGHSTASIVQYGVDNWGVGRWGVQRYINAIHKRWSKQSEKNKDNAYNDHIAMRHELIRNAEDQRVKLEAMKDLAKLQSLYEDRQKITHAFENMPKMVVEIVGNKNTIS